jgi:excisionase family DNA binding protein
MKEYLRVDEVAELLQVCKKTVYKLINATENPLKSSMVGTQLRIKRSDLEEYLEKNVTTWWK